MGNPPDALAALFPTIRQHLGRSSRRLADRLRQLGLARIIEASGLDYTILRPAWLNDWDEIDYATTQKEESFKNASEQVSRKSVADLVVKLATTPGLEIRSSLGVHKAP